MTMSSVSVSHLTSALTTTYHDLLRRTTNRQLVVAASLFAVGVPVLRGIRADYRKWLSLGKGGSPHNFFGYIVVQLLATAGDSDVHSTVLYVREGQQSALESTSFLEAPVPTRAGPRPVISKWAAPVRQVSGMASEDVKLKLLTAIKAVATADPSTVTARFSDIEGQTHPHNALHVSPSAADPTRRFATRGPGEFYHVHPTDGSAHCIVSAADAKLLIEAGWGERHPLSGAGIGGFPSNYILIYAPRSDEEIGVHENIARAAAKYAASKGLAKAT